MNKEKTKQSRQILFHHLKTAQERLGTASLILDREIYEDAVPILFKSVADIMQVLLQLKNMPAQDVQKNLQSLEKELIEEKIWHKNTINLFYLLNDLNKKYINETEVECDKDDIKNIFQETENFLNKTRKFLKAHLSTPRERIIRQRIKKIFLISGISMGSLLIVSYLINQGLNKFGEKHGLLAAYYNNTHLEEPPAVEKIDKNIDFIWGRFKPHKKIKGAFSVRWEGKIKIDKSGHYTFYILSDEGIRFYLDDKMTLNTWTSQTRTLNNSYRTYLEKGFHKIKLEYFFNQRHADIKLLWSSDFFKKRIIESKVLYPNLEE
ncbi:MAG: PA14 domain-containing protein [Acidobacteriota bacterium]